MCNELINNWEDIESEDDLEETIYSNLEETFNLASGCTDPHSDDPGREYHIDIWFEISKHIDAKDVGCFASICRNTYLVTSKSTFWKMLYERHYKEDIVLPKDLQPENIFHSSSIRCRVIRSMFYLSPPLVNSISNQRPFHKDPDKLISALCLSVWYEKVDKHWRFNFQFRRPAKPKLIQDKSGTESTDENCCVLQVISSTFLLIPFIAGQFLHNVFLSVGYGMQYHKLKLVFGPQYLSRKTAMTCGDIVKLDPVINLKLFDWWHPQYPTRKPKPIVSEN